MPHNKICFLNGLDGPDDVIVRSSEKADNILITLGNRRAVEYNINDRSVVNNYFLPSHMSFSTPVATYSPNGDLVCVVNKTQLMIWNGRNTNFEQAEVVKLPSPVSDLLIEDCKNKVLVFENGDLQSVEYLRNDVEMQHQHTKCPHLPNIITKTRILSHDGIKHCIHIGQDSGCLYRMSLDDRKYTQTYIRSFQLNGASLIEVSGNKLVYIMKNDIESTVYFKDIFNSNISDTCFKPPDVSKISALSSLTSNHVAFICKGLGDQDGNFIKILDICYQTVVANIPMKTFSSNQLICVNGDKIFFKQGSKIACWTIEMLPQGLCDLVGCNMDQISLDLNLANGDVPVRVFSEENSFNGLIQKLLQDDYKFDVELINEHLPDLVKIALIENALNESDNEQRQLRNALLIPFTDQVVLDHIKNLNFSSAKILVHRLVKIMQMEEITGNPSEFEHYITWLALILDAHYTNFMVAKDNEAKEVITECSNLLGELDYSVNMLATVMSRIKMMKKDDHVHVSNRLFSVEVVHF